MGKEQIIFLIFTILFAICGVAEVYFCFKNEKLRKYLKGVPLLFLILMAVILRPTDPLVYCALIFGLIGDLFLLSWNKQMFMVGTISFLLEHVLYATRIYLSSETNYTWHLALMIVGGYLICMVFAYAFLTKFMNMKFMVLCSSYAFMLVMNFFVLITFIVTTKNMFLVSGVVGYVLFIISDFFVLQKRFIKKYSFQQPVIMSTYYCAQYLILLTFLLPLIA